MQRRPGLETAVKVTEKKLEKLPYLAAFVVDDKTTKGQMPVIEGWNKMRERLLLLGEMESS